MNYLEEPIKKGVSMPETCKELNWQVETNYFWVYNHGWILFSQNDLDIADAYFSKLEKYPAPQMHEIAPLLPISISQIIFEKREVFYLVLRPIIEKGGELIYEHPHRQFSLNNIQVLYENNHFAEVYAQMYLKLKKRNY